MVRGVVTAVVSALHWYNPSSGGITGASSPPAGLEGVAPGEHRKTDQCSLSPLFLFMSLIK